jgi:hypothetical protein
MSNLYFRDKKSIGSYFEVMFGNLGSIRTESWCCMWGPPRSRCRHRGQCIEALLERSPNKWKRRSKKNHEMYLWAPIVSASMVYAGGGRARSGVPQSFSKWG